MTDRSAHPPMTPDRADRFVSPGEAMTLIPAEEVRKRYPHWFDTTGAYVGSVTRDATDDPASGDLLPREHDEAGT